MLSIRVLAAAFALMSLSTVYAQPSSAPSASTDAELIQAASDGNVSRVELLMKKGANINATAKNGYTALMIAVQTGKKDAAQTLVAQRR